MKFTLLPSWQAVRTFVSQNGFAYYKPPMNHAPRKVRAKNHTKTMGIRIYASEIDPEADNFTADDGHLDRFYEAAD